MSRKNKSRRIREESRRPLTRFAGPVVILAAAGLAAWPLVQMGPSCGADFSFHFVSWIEAQRSMLAGILYPHWASGPNFGAGEPRFVFYPPLTWMAGALLGMVMPWREVSVALVYLLLAATGFTTRALARHRLSDGPATLAGCASIFLGNMLVDVYTRSDFGELAGGFWIPLLLLFQLRDRSPGGTRLARVLEGAAPLALVVAGIWLTNGPLGIMASFLLAATGLVTAGMERSWLPVGRAAFASALGAALAAVYLVPALGERGWANFGAAISEREYVFENGWLFHSHGDPAWTHYDTTVDLHSWLAVIMCSIAMAMLLVLWKRGVLRAGRAWWIPLALIPVAVLLMQLPVSEPLWRTLPGLRFLQFPWRWLVLMNAPVAVFFAAAVWVTPLRGRVPILAGCAILFFLVSGGTWGICNEDCRGADATILSVEQTYGLLGKPEYAPPGIRHALLDPNVPGDCEVSALGDTEAAAGQDQKQNGRAFACEGKFSRVSDQPEHKIVMGTADRAGFLILRLRSFPAWRLTVNGRRTSAAREENYGLMAVPIPQGPVVVRVDWATTPDVWAGRWLGLLALAAIVALWRAGRTPIPPQVS
ncbi:MAG: hypothetical protein WCC26_16160 [Terracidiphilus sp.]